MIFNLKGVLGRRGPERGTLRIGFLPTLDAATLLVAQSQGCFAAEGLNVSLQRQTSWHRAQQRLAAGDLEAAHLPATAPLAGHLGLNGEQRPLRTAFVLAQGGGALVLNPTLVDALGKPARQVQPASLAQALAALIVERREQRASRLRFAVSDRFGPGVYILRHWLAHAGVDPLRDIELSVVTPARVLASLASGRYAGAWLDEPYASLAASQGSAVAMFSQHDFWNHSLGAVLTVREALQKRRPRAHRAMLRALLTAAHWLETHREEVLPELADALGLPPEALLSLRDGLSTRAGQYAGDLRFAAGAASFPWYSQAVWYLGQMIRWGDYAQVLDFKKTAQAIYQPALYREAARDLHFPYPSIGYKNEGLHPESWLLEEASEPIPMGSDAMFDGAIYKPRQTMKYLNGLEISHIKAPLDAMWAIR